VTYEDLVQRHKLDPSWDTVQDQGARVGFNGITTIERKTQLAVDRGLGGVMIWESGQDCRVDPVRRGDKTHVTTCPNGEHSSLLRAIIRVAESAGLKQEL